MRRSILLLLALTLALPLAAADEPPSEPPADEPTETPADPPIPGPETDETTSCRTFQYNGPSNSRPMGAWLIVDPDGCYRTLVDRVVPPLLGFVHSRLP